MLEPKLEATFKPIIESMVDLSTSYLAPSAVNTSLLNQTIESIGTTSNTPLVPSGINHLIQAETSKNFMQKVSVEDFIPNEKPKISTPKLTTAVSNPLPVSKTKVLKKSDSKPIKLEKPLKSDMCDKIKPKSESQKKVLLIEEPALEEDPTKEYKFVFFLFVIKQK